MRVFVTMLGFNTVEMIEGALKNFEESTTDAEHRRCIKTLFNPGFPGTDRARLKALACEYGWWLTDIPNRGVVENHNVAIHDYCHMEKGDFYVTFDPDVRMRQKGWVSAMIEALSSDRDAVFVCASRTFHNEEWCVKQHGRSIKILPSGLRIARYHNLIAWSMGMYKGEWLATRPRNFAAENPHYGYAEHCEYDRMRAAKRTWLQVSDFYDDHQGADAKYTEWKRQSGAHQTKISFEQWLKENP